VGPLDHPWTQLRLKPVSPKDEILGGGFAGDSLMSAHRVDREIYTTRATPLGDKLIVEPYHGQFGVFSLGPGNRNLKEIAVSSGSLQSAMMAFGFAPDSSMPKDKQKKMREFRVPVGDYLPSYLVIQYDKLHFSVSDNYHSEGLPRDMERRRVYGIFIRRDKPFVLDFSNKPEVMFASPAKDKKFKPGDEVLVKAVLVDPVLNLMVRRLENFSQTKKETYRLPNGKEESYDRPLSLDPVVTITDSSGKKVAEGIMPFG
jgi:hypothetical protein